MDKLILQILLLKDIKGESTINSEKGYTLILVMIIISLTMIFGLAISGAALNSSKQFSNTENLNKATDLAEMGVTYYESQLKAFLNEQLYNQTQKDVMNSLFTGTESNSLLIERFKTQFPIKLNNLYQTDNALFTNSADQFLPEKTVDANSSFKIKIDPNGIIPTTCTTNTPSNSQCFSINFESYGYIAHNLQRKLKATLSYSYLINPDNIVITPNPPETVPKFQNLINTMQSKNLQACTTANFDNNITTAECSTNWAPSNTPSTNGFDHSYLVFKNGADFEHLSHSVSSSTLFIYGVNNTPVSLGKFNPNGFTESQIVIIGNAKLFDSIMKPVNSSIYITGDADLTGFELKNSDSLTKVCVAGTITPARMKNISGVYSYIDNPTTYKANCMENSNQVGTNSLKINGPIISSTIANKSIVTY